MAVCNETTSESPDCGTEPVLAVRDDTNGGGV